LCARPVGEHRSALWLGGSLDDKDKHSSFFVGKFSDEKRVL
jgi:hypothetical protein